MQRAAAIVEVWKRPGLWVCAAVLAALGWATLRFWPGAGGERTRPTQSADRLARVMRKDLVLKLTESGTLKAVNSHKLKAEGTREMKLVKIVPEGTLVKKGDMVAELGREETERAVKDLELQLDAAEKAVRVAEGELRVQRINNANALRNIEAQALAAERNFTKYIELEGPKLEKELSVKLSDAKVKLEDAQKARRDLVARLENDLFVEDQQEEQNRKDLENANRAIKTAQTALEATILEQKLFKLYAYPMEASQRGSQHKLARMQMEQAQIVAESGLVAKETALARARLEFGQRGRDLEKTKQALGKLVILAPVEGLVTYGDGDDPWRRQNQRIQPGMQCWGGMVLATIPDTSAYEVVMRVGEEYRSRMKTGQEAVVTFEALGKTSLAGKVAEIGNIPTGRNDWDPESPKVYDVKVHLPTTHPDLAPGMSVRVELILGRLSNVLVVPIDAVRREEGRTYCWIEGVPPIRREVETGPGTDEEVSIEKGISEGEQVLLGRTPGESKP